MGLVDLFVVSCIPVLKLLIVSAVGSLLAIDQVNILGDDARKYLNNVVFYVFSPSLIGTNLAKTITFDSMRTLWFMPLNILIIFIIGSAFGWIVNQITKAPSNLRGLIVGCCSAGNLGNLLLITIPAVCKEKGSPFGDPVRCHTYGMAYATLSMAIGAVYIWLYVYNIMRIYSSKKTTGVEVNVSVDADSFEGTSKPLLDSCNEPLLPSSTMSSNESFKGSLFVKLKQKLKMIDEKVNFKRLFAPSTIAAIIGFVVGLVPGIRNLLIGESAPFRVIEDSTALLSDGAVPVMTLVLGGNLMKGLKGSGIKMSIIVWIIIVRYVLLPIMGIFIVKTAIHFGLINSDPLYQFVLLLQYTLPPAMNIGVISQLFGEGMKECSMIMLWTYILAPVSLTLWCTVFMWLVSY
ncbi:hypothetical protein ACHQM5_025394 [Ranunculus cassubicifolius]